MKRQILAVFVGIALTAAVLTPSLSTNNAFAQVSAESRVLQAILGLTDQIKQQTTEIKGKYDDTIFDLNLKKKFYAVQFEASVSGIGLGISACPNSDEGACAFNVESIQIDCSNDPVPITEIVVDDALTDISDKGITTPTNLLVDTSIGRIGASEFVIVNFGQTCESAEIMFTGEKPQDVLFGTGG